MKYLKIDELNFAKDHGLMPVVVQGSSTREILMLAYANQEALEATIRTGYAHYWSRSRKSLWKKGETSGNTQCVKHVLVDCDGDALIYIVDQKGVACHTGERSCFYTELEEQPHKID